MRVYEPVPYWQENEIAVVVLLRVFARAASSFYYEFLLEQHSG